MPSYTHIHTHRQALAVVDMVLGLGEIRFSIGVSSALPTTKAVGRNLADAIERPVVTFSGRTERLWRVLENVSPAFQTARVRTQLKILNPAAVATGFRRSQTLSYSTRSLGKDPAKTLRPNRLTSRQCTRPLACLFVCKVLPAGLAGEELNFIRRELDCDHTRASTRIVLMCQRKADLGPSLLRTERLEKITHGQ